jgi:hypothetical protein
LVEPEATFRKAQNQKENMKIMHLTIVAIGLAAAMSASATIYSGSDFASMASANGTYVPGTPGYEALSFSSPAVDAVVGVRGPLGTLNQLNMSFQYSDYVSAAGTAPFAAFGISVDGTWGGASQEYDVISEQGNLLTGTTLVHVWDLNTGADVAGLSDVTLNTVLGIDNPFNGVPFGDLEVMRAYAYIGDEGASIGSVNIDSITVSTVPEPTTILSGVLMLLPFGASALRFIRRKTAV